MKVLLALFTTITLLLAGCSSKEEVKPEAVLSALQKAGIPIAKSEIYTAETDTNKQLGRPNQYIAKANWADSRLQQPAGDMAGGTVEIFKSEADLKARKDYVDNIGKAMPMMAQYQYSKGLVLIRLEKALTPEQAAEYEKVLNSL